MKASTVQKRRSVESGILILGLCLLCICMLSPTAILAGQTAPGQPDAYESLYWNSVQDSNNPAKHKPVCVAHRKNWKKKRFKP